MTRWIELVVTFQCNCRCRFCPSPLQTGTRPMDAGEIAGWLEDARRRGAEHAWFGGGEPTLHPDLVSSIEIARELGYETIRIQSNGMRFAYLPFTRSCLKAGANDFSLLITGDAATHDTLTRNPEATARLFEGIRHLVGEGARVRGDILITRPSVEQLPGILERFGELGLRHFTFWLVSRFGMEVQGVEKLLPRMKEVVPHLQAAFDTADRLGVTATSWHTPPCVLDPAYRDRYLHSATLELEIVTPGSRPFRAEESPMEGGAFLESCGRCRLRRDCLGPRQDYLDWHGPAEFEPV